ARLATFGSCMSCTVTSQEGQATLWTRATVSWQAGHPALKTSILRFVAMFISPVDAPDLKKRSGGSRGNACDHFSRPGVPQRRTDQGGDAAVDSRVGIQDELARHQPDRCQEAQGEGAEASPPVSPVAEGGQSKGEAEHGQRQEVIRLHQEAQPHRTDEA